MLSFVVVFLCIAVRRGLEVRSTRAITIENKTQIIAQPQ